MVSYQITNHVTETKCESKKGFQILTYY